MAHTSSARKRIRQSEKKNLRNKSYKSKMRTITKKFLAVIQAGDSSNAETSFREVSKEIMKTATKNVIHKNQASRRISRLAKKLNNIKTA